MTSKEIPVHIALGSNLGNPENFLEEAREALRKLPLEKMKCSSILKSSPLLGMAIPRSGELFKIEEHFIFSRGSFLSASLASSRKFSGFPRLLPKAM